jgi:hypothetical protein
MLARRFYEFRCHVKRGNHVPHRAVHLSIERQQGFRNSVDQISACMPSDRTFAARPRIASRPWAGKVEAASISVSERTRSGLASTKACEMIPPTDKPTR